MQYQSECRNALESVVNISKSFQKVFMDAMKLFMAIPNRVNFLQMGRYGCFSEQTYRNNFENDDFDWFSFNEAIIREHLKGGRKAIAVDPSFIPKSGSKTPWIGYFWSGCAGEYKRGLEITGIGVIDVDNHECMTLGSVQTPDNATLESYGKNLVDWYSSYLISIQEHLKRISGTVVCDAFFSKATFIKPLCTRYIMMQNHLKTPPDHPTLLKILLKRHLGYTPGKGKCYSNLGYMILSMIIEKKSGMKYENFMQKYVLHPAGCYDMHIAGTYLKDRRPNETKYYMHQGSIPVYEYNNSGRLVEKCYGDTDLPRLSGAGAWCGSTAELSRFIASIDGLPHVKDILSKKSIEFMTREQADHQYSIGWNYTPKSNKPWIRTGSLAGTSAIVLKYPDNQCWILITNTSTWKGHGFSNDTMAFFEKLRKKYMANMPKKDLFL